MNDWMEAAQAANVDAERNAAPRDNWETRYRTLEVIAQKRLDEMVRLLEENSELRRRLGHGR